MKIMNTATVKYVKCPNYNGHRSINGQVAQVLTSANSQHVAIPSNTWRCTACGKDHS